MLGGPVGLANGKQLATKIIMDHTTLFNMAARYGFCEQFNSKYRNTIRVARKMNGDTSFRDAIFSQGALHP